MNNRVFLQECLITARGQRSEGGRGETECKQARRGREKKNRRHNEEEMRSGIIAIREAEEEKGKSE